MSIKKTTIGTSCIVGDGAHASINRVEIGVPYLTSKNFNQDGIYLQKVDYISEQDYQKHFREDSKALTKPSEGDLIFSIIGSIGGAHLYNKTDRFGLSSSVAIIRPNIREVYPQFLLYYLKSPYLQKWLEATKSGSAQGFLSLEMIKNLPLSLPSLPIQQKIASILSAYDELIENNKQRIKLLEEMAEEIYKEWFVRLRFPNYENTEFVDGLPLGWEETKLEAICDFLMGQSPPSEFYNEEKNGLPFHQGVTNFNSRFPSHVIYCTDLKRIVDEGDILLSVRAPVGRINIANTKLVIGRGLCGIKHKENLPNYCYHLLKDIFKIEDSFGNGSVFNAVSKNDLLKIKVINPDVKICSKFQVLIKPLDDEIQILTEKNQLLQQTRDLLLPRLISGKLSVAGLLENKVYKIGENEACLSMVAEDGV